MGLDMYLNKRTFIGAAYEHRDVKGNVFITVVGKELPIQFNRISTVEERLAYWRKANAIHKWFVDNCQEGEDDCRRADVSIEQLKILLKTCKDLLSTMDTEQAEKVLPPEEGFFFGSTDVDQGYWEDIKYTADILEKILVEPGIEAADIYYHSSW